MNRIMLVEDNPGQRHSIAALLGKRLSDLQIAEAKDAKEAIVQLTQGPFDVVITDMRMENPHAGYDLLLAVKGSNPRTQFVVCTAYSAIDDAFRCARLDCLSYIDKNSPDFPEQLTRTVVRAIELSSLSRDSLTERLILSYWDDVHIAGDKAKKGVVLENLCSFLFRSIPGWSQIESRVRNQSEEIDLVVVNESQEEFWRRYGTILLIECKNWSQRKKPGRPDYDAFSSKIRRRGQNNCGLGFFISLGGVANTFIDQAYQGIAEGIVVVTLDENALWQLTRAENRSDMLKKMVLAHITGTRS